MGVKLILAVISVLFIVSLMFFYFTPFSTINFAAKTENSNFSAFNGADGMQFYSMMRFPDSKISYRISNCPLQKKNDMESAFDIAENLTVLTFYPVNSDEEISVTCEERDRASKGLFIAGEGGPTNITGAGDYYVILNGEISLIKESECPTPNIALHELFHVLGFEHSPNTENLMYNITKCSQTIGEDMIQLINNLYSVQSNPDLMFENVSAVMNGRFLNLNLTVLNAGLNDSQASKIIIYADENVLKEIILEPVAIGHGRFIGMGNIWVPQISISELSLVIDSNFDEIKKENNKIKLEIKNN